MGQEERSLSVVNPGGSLVEHGRYAMPLIDIAGEKAVLDNYRAFISEVLDPAKGHYGKMPGVDRAFLQQPGAEILYRAIQARPEYELIESITDRGSDYAYFLYKCRVVHAGSGLVMGEDVGVCSTDEYASNCTLYRENAEWNGPHPGQQECPVHGPMIPVKKKVDGKWSWVCPKKLSRPLADTLQNTSAKAKKRAMVAAIRTVGCVSEIFSQDSELIPEEQGPNDDAPPRQSPRRQQQAQPQQGPPDEQPPAQARRAPAKQAGAAPAQQAAPAEAGFSKEDMAAAFGTIKASGVTVDELKAYLNDNGVHDGKSAVMGSHLAAVASKHQMTLAEVAAAVVRRFSNPTPAAADIVEGDFTEEGGQALDGEDVVFE